MLISKTQFAAPTLTQLPAEVDEDGKVDIAVQVTIPDVDLAIQYEVEVSVATSSGGTFVVIDNKTSAATTREFKAKSTRWYKAQYRPIYESGLIGSWSALSAELKPSKKSAAVTAPTSLTATARPRGNRLRWSKSTEADYRETIIYRHTADVIGSATEIDRVTGTVHLDQDAMTIGATYYYWVSHVDKSGNVSAKYPAVNGVSVAHAAVVAADTDQTALAAPSGTPTFTQRNRDVNGDGKIDIIAEYSGATVAGAYQYEIELSSAPDVAGSPGTFAVIDKWSAPGFPTAIDMNTNLHYKARHRALAFNNVPGGWSAYTAVFKPVPKSDALPAPGLLLVEGKPWAVKAQISTPLDKDFSHTNLYFSVDTPDWASAGLLGSTNGNLFERRYDVKRSIYIWATHVNTSGVESAKYPSGDTAGKEAIITGIETADIENGAITPALISTGGAFRFLRVHANDDATVYAFGADTTACAFLHNNGYVAASRTDANALALQRVGSNGGLAQFYRGTTNVGSISVTTTATAFNTSSDYRLKYDVEPLVTVSLADPADADWLPDMLKRILAARPVSFRWVSDDNPASPLTYGFIAHELQTMFPEAVTGEKDAVEAIGTATIDGKVRENITERDAIEGKATDWQATGDRPVYQSVDHSKLVPSLMASVQELTMLVLELRREIEALKA